MLRGLPLPLLLGSLSVWPIYHHFLFMNCSFKAKILVLYDYSQVELQVKVTDDERPVTTKDSVQTSI